MELDEQTENALSSLQNGDITYIEAVKTADVSIDVFSILVSERGIHHYEEIKVETNTPLTSRDVYIEDDVVYIQCPVCGVLSKISEVLMKQKCSHCLSSLSIRATVDSLPEKFDGEDGDKHFVDVPSALPGQERVPAITDGSEKTEE